VWATRSVFWQLATEPRAVPEQVPRLAGLSPFLTVDDDRFLCTTSDSSRQAVVDLRGDAVAEVPLPLSGWRYSRALNALVRCTPTECEIWGLDGRRVRTIAI
jgi:hypothetical protein